MNSSRLTAVAVVVSLAAAPASAQATPPPAQPQAQSQTQAQTPTPAGRLRVFIECDECFTTFLREEIEWVDFVRQPQDADVHIIGTDTQTGGGGEEIALRFIGLGRFKDVNNELKVVTQSGDTDDMRRQRVLRTITVGLLFYLERAGRGGDVRIDVDPVTQGGGQTKVADDPWKAWVFSLRGGGSTDLQESNREWNWDARATADRVTELWILSFGASTEQQREEFNLDEEDEEPLKVTRSERNFNWFAARGLGQHWSAGFTGELTSSTFNNRRFGFATGAAIEYNVFPYADYASRQLRLTYTIGAQHAKYTEVTLFDKLEETNPIHVAEATLDQVQPWGELSVRAEFSQYLHDTSKYQFEVGGDLSFRITRGLSLELDGSASRVRDQLSLPKRDASPEEVLLRLRELQSGYQIDFSLNITYRFGSMFNNIVNPRFGRN